MPRLQSSSPSSPPARPATVALLELDADLRAAVPSADHLLAARCLRATVHELPAGPLDIARLQATEHPPFAALALDGLLTRRLLVGSRACVHMVGAGDLLRPWSSADLGPATSDDGWTVHERARLALLDGRFVLAAQRWPALITAVQKRLLDQLDQSIALQAVLALPRVEQRLVGVLLHISERTGVVRPDGIHLNVAFDHRTLGEFVGARRPTTSLAVQALERADVLHRSDDGRWRLAHHAAEWFGAAAAAAG